MTSYKGTNEMLTATEAEQIALQFLMEDLNVPDEEQEWFTILISRLVDEKWYVVEIGVEGLPDKWALQVYDTKECDPNYTFVSPIKPADGNSDVLDMPERVAEILIAERGA